MHGLAGEVSESVSITTVSSEAARCLSAFSISARSLEGTFMLLGGRSLASVRTTVDERDLEGRDVLWCNALHQRQTGLGGVCAGNLDARGSARWPPSLPEPYDSRSTTAGSIREARHAGRPAANAAIVAKTSALSASVRGFPG